MSSQLVVTAVGSDRVGIVDDISQILLEFDCNIEESRMTLLGGEFAMMLLVSGAEEAVGAVATALPECGERLGLDFFVKKTYEAATTGAGIPYQLDCVSLDTPGIVHVVTGLLRERGISIDDLETETTGAPFTGAPLFRMRVTCIIPKSVSVGKLRSELQEIAESHDLDISVQPLVAGKE
ncbi:MAG: glycine cleavage system protein R [Spirochaetales bacterium]